MSTEALDQELHKIMDDLANSAETPDGAVRAAFLIGDVNRLAKLWDAPDTRPQADAMLDAWSHMDGLRKRIADHWIDRAKSIVTNGVTPAVEARTEAEVNAPGAPAPKAIQERKVHPILARFRALQVTRKGVAA